MKRKLPLIAGVIIGLALLLPVATGLLAKNRFYNLIAQLQTNNPSLNITATYHLGWLSSTASVNWALTKSPVQLPAIETTVIIHHGPFILAKDENATHHVYFGIALLDLKLPALPQNSMVAVNFQRQQFSSTILISFSLHYKARLHAAIHATVTVANQELARINLDNLLLTATMKSDLKYINSNFVLSNLNINAGDHGYLNIPQITVKMNMHNDQDVYLGDEIVTIPAIELSVPTMVQFKLYKFNSSFSGEKNNATVNYNLQLALHSVLYNNASYGPFAFDLQIKHLNFAALSQIQQKFKAYAKNERLASADNVDKSLTVLQQELKQLLAKLIQKNTAVNLKQLDFSMPAGNFRSTGHVHFITAPEQITDIGALLKITNINYHVIASKDLAAYLISILITENFAIDHFDPVQILMQLTQANFIQQKDGFYHLDITVKQGVPYINNQLFNNKMLQQLQATAPIAAQ